MKEGKTTTMKAVINILKVLIIGALVVISAGALFEVNRHEFVDNIYSSEYKAINLHIVQSIRNVDSFKRLIELNYKR